MTGMCLDICFAVGGLPLSLDDIGLFGILQGFADGGGLSCLYSDVGMDTW